MTDARRFTLALPDGEMAGLEFGDPGRPIDVIFLHATGFNASTYRNSLGEAAAGGLRIVALDQRGHGLSRMPTDPDELQDWGPFGLDLLSAIEALRLTRPVVLSGHSMGGAVSLHAAAELGERVKGLVLFDPVIMAVRDPQKWVDAPLVVGARRRRPNFESKAAALQAYLGRGAFKTWPPQAVADYVEDGFRPDGDQVTLTCAPAWEAAIFSVSTLRDPRKALERISAPVEVMKAEHGATCHLDAAHYIDPFPNRRMITVPGSSHFLPIERPDLVASSLQAACA
jgi:pimeloyl-ACP methyl ester carboxylesterase